MSFHDKYQNMSRLELLKETVLGQLKCCPCDYRNLESVEFRALNGSEDAFEISYSGPAESVHHFDDGLKHHLADRDFQFLYCFGTQGCDIIDREKPYPQCWLMPRDAHAEGRWIVADVRADFDYDLLLEMPVMVCTDTHTHTLTLADAIARYGQNGEPDLNDFRRFARCPMLHGFIGPIFPNEGYVARYESPKTYEMMTR